MIVVIPFYSGDSWLAVKNIKQWIKFDSKVPYECLLAYDDLTDPEQVKNIAQEFFSAVHEYKYTSNNNRRWPYASNWAFQQTGWHIYNSANSGKLRKEPWLWMESDCVALRPGWIYAVDECHTRGNKPFTGHINHTTNVWNGVSVYPWNAVCYGHNMWFAEANPWDVVASNDDHICKFVNEANHLFQHLWSDPNTGEAATFKNFDDVKRLVRKGVCLFHRCKDGTLMDVMERYNWSFDTRPQGLIEGFEPSKESVSNDVLLVSPFCNKDAECNLMNFLLMEKWGEKYDHDILLSYDDITEMKWIDQISSIAKKIFRNVRTFSFPVPEQKPWPFPQNYSFRATARYVESHFHIPWMWWEPDAVPLHKGWFNDLVVEYFKAGKPFMGHVVKSMGHMNGTGFYPWDLSKYSSQIFTSPMAFDVAMKEETIKHTHDCAHMIENIICVNKAGVPMTGNGRRMTFKKKETFDKYVNPKMCLFHKCSDGTLAQYLFNEM